MSPLLRAGSLTIDLRACRARIDDRLLELTAKEFDLLAYLMARPGQVFSREQLLNEVWHSTAEWQQPATVTEHVRRLRAKIETEPRRPQILRTVRGAGYCLDIPEEPRHGPDTGIAFAPGTIVHVDGHIMRADEAAAFIFGLNVPAALIGRQISELVSLASRPALERLSTAPPGLERRTQLIDLERVVDGRNLTVEVASAEFLWNGNRAQHLTLTPVRDLSAQLRGLVTAVLSEVTDAVIIMDPHFHVRSWNGAAERFYGWKERDVLGGHILDIIGWISDDTDPTDIWDTLVRTSRWMGSGQFVTRDGSAASVRACTTLIRDDAGAPVAIVSVTHPSPAANALRPRRLTQVQKV